MATDVDALQATTLRKHLEQYGFDDNYLGEDFRGAQITVVKNHHLDLYESALRPVKVNKRSKNRVVPVSRFLHLGDRLKFSSTMKSMMVPSIRSEISATQFFQKPFSTSALLALYIFWKLKGINLDQIQMSNIEGWICGHENPPFSIFPFDQWLTVNSIATTWIDLYPTDGPMWRLGTVVFTEPEHIKFLQRD